MSKRSWNNGTRELEEIAGSVILNEGANTFGSAMRDLDRISGEQEADKLYGAIHAEVQGGKSVEEVLKDMNYPEDRHKVMAISYKNWLASKSEDAEGIVGNLDDEVDASNEEDDDVTEVVEGIVDRVFDVSDKVIDFATKPTQYDDAFAKDILAGIKRGSKIANRTIGGVVKGAGEVVKGVAKGISEVGKGAIQGATEDGENKSLKDEFLEFAEKVSAVDEGRDIDIMVLRSELNRLDDILADKEHAAAQKEM